MYIIQYTFVGTAIFAFCLVSQRLSCKLRKCLKRRQTIHSQSPCTTFIM